MNDPADPSNIDITDVIAKELWALAELRPDFEDLPTWIPQFEAVTSNEHGPERARIATERGRSVLRSVANRYATDADGIAFAQLESSLFQDQDAASFEILSAFFVDAVQQAARFRKGIRRLPVAIHSNEIFVGRHTRISFNRTLRIPEDGRAYPLPAGLGRLPILPVEDYAERVPEQWLEQGGFIIPLYQREALFLEFGGVQWRPTIGKVSVGRVNAISGKTHDLKIRSHRQDYVVIPDQRWLDGINSGNGSVSQFVAMPLGKGYTIEAQTTDEERYGGFQLAIFDPRAGRFPEEDPKEKKAALAARRQRVLRADQKQLLDRLPTTTQEVIRVVQEKHYQDAAKALGMSGKEILKVIEDARLYFENALGTVGFDGVIPNSHLMGRVQYMPAMGDISVASQREMGIAAGGKIRQEILEDTYGVESWDESAFRDAVIHIVNSEVYQEITGREAPPSPITKEQYYQYGIPWYSDYNEKAPSLSPVAAFKRVFSIGQIDKNRGIGKEEAAPRREIQPEEILRIRTPTLEERWKALLDRAVESSKSGQHRIAAREASFALDLSDKHPLPYFIRAVSNHYLGHHSDAEADATACLKLQPDHQGALAIRAFSSLALGELLLAKEDAELILVKQPNDHDGLYVHAEASLRLQCYKEALSDADKILRNDPTDLAALRIKAEALTKIGDGNESSRDVPHWPNKPLNDRKDVGQGSESTVLVSAPKFPLPVLSESGSSTTQLTPADSVVSVGNPSGEHSTVRKTIFRLFWVSVTIAALIEVTSTAWLENIKAQLHSLSSASPTPFPTRPQLHSQRPYLIPLSSPSRPSVVYTDRTQRDEIIERHKFVPGFSSDAVLLPNTIPGSSPPIRNNWLLKADVRTPK